MKKVLILIVSNLLLVGSLFAQEDTTKTHSKNSGKENNNAANVTKTVKQETKVVKKKIK